MSFLAFILGSYEGFAGKIGSPNMTKEDYDQVDPEEMGLMDIHWCMASVIRKAQRFIEITGRKCLEGPDMKIGFDEAKVTFFKCKQKGHFKKECSNCQANDSVNLFHDDYYKKAIYHRNNEQPTRKQIEEGSSKEKKQAMLMIHDECSDPSMLPQEDEGLDWGKYIKEEKKEQKWVLMAEIKRSREEEEARGYLDNVYDAYKEARWARRWDIEKESYVDPKGNPTVDPNEVNFEASVATIPTVDVWCRGLREIPWYREKVEEKNQQSDLYELGKEEDNGGDCD
ncbi:putative transcription factor interactor and regulator CCHC(Zn) family [Helianthus annuus]|uniref:Transcription factor interactor and regulator CCHC(Zn) family n=1 Tax=Helianthus annuus TaxID=4232 RepID=A0A9K3I3S0_HELAN|nr:putative transcription factor interactor and regulator CCHC(Zn) family [Helianthus annuus]KAJ0706114.1 putative transcription factor interactor and regulator CCHC(Zn) family [Helianthus annuus]KAJ0886575.1 putative transcription factor interactor and regulator CCHC(Zn) family [Helianthus annuus]